MCSSPGPVGQPLLRGSTGRGHAPSIAAELHAVLDRLLDADLTGLSADEHAGLVTATLRAQHRLAAATLDAVAAFDTADVAATTRHRTTKRWIEMSTRTSASASSGLTRTARALRAHLPATRDALSDGLISASHVSAIVSVVSTIGPEHAVAAEPILLDLAREAPPPVVRAAAARIHALVDPGKAEKDLHAAYEKRGLRLSVGGAYGYLSGIFDLESTELLQSALMPLMTRTGPDDTRTLTQLRADALLDLAKRGLDTGLDTQLGGERPHVSVVIDEHALRAGLGTVDAPWTGTALPAGIARRWTCDSQLTPVLATPLQPPAGPVGTASPVTISLGGGWLPLNVGRAARTVTTAQLKALRVRDGGCIHPGCQRTGAYCDAHHVIHWADGGSTDLDNLALLCRHHHRTLHTGHWTLTPDPDRPGYYLANSAGWTTPAQTSTHRTPPITISASTRGRDPARSLWQE